jgi:hypothetical protein
MLLVLLLCIVLLVFSLCASMTGYTYAPYQGAWRGVCSVAVLCCCSAAVLEFPLRASVTGALACHAVASGVMCHVA